MGEYKHISLDERKKIYMFKKEGKGVIAIAAELGRPPSSISRELKRNSIDIGYLPDSANEMYKKRRLGRKNKITSNEGLRAYIILKLQEGWSPEQISGRMKIEKNTLNVSHETIYQFAYSAQGKALSLWKLLFYKQSKRSQIYGRKHQSQVIKERIDIHHRPTYIENRIELGHFEGDLTFFHGSRSSNLTVLTERTSRFTALVKNGSKRADEVTKGIIQRMTTLTPLSITFDNGSEFAHHTTIKSTLGIQTYFCDPGSPWQKGTVENSICRLHRYIPKNSDLKYWPDNAIQNVEHYLNKTPRKILGFLTPYEVFFKQNRSVALQT